MDNEANKLKPSDPADDFPDKPIMMIETFLVEKVTFNDGSHAHRRHLHTQHKIAITMNVQVPGEIMPRLIQQNLCPGCGLMWWVELQRRG